MTVARTERDSPDGAPTVSVVMRTRDRELLLGRALDDVLAQTSADWELIVLNDGGESRLVDDAVAARRAAFGTRVRVEHLDHPVGRDGILQTGLQLSRGALFAIHDDDDTWHPDFLSRTVDWLLENSGDVAVAVATDLVVEQVQDGALLEISRTSVSAPLGRVSFTDLIVGSMPPPIGMLLRTQSARDVGGFSETLSVAGDWELVRRLAITGPIGYIPGPALAEWRHRPDADGHLANSVIGAESLHHQTNRALEDRAVRDHVAEHGFGGLVFMHALLRSRLAPLEIEIIGLRAEVVGLRETLADQNSLLLERAQWLDDRVHHHTQYHSPVATLRRSLGRLLPGRSAPRDHRGA